MKNKNRTCGMFVFNNNKELLVVKPENSKFWFIPNGKHSFNRNFLEVAIEAVYNETGIEFFNYKEEVFNSLKHVSNKKNTLVPYFIDKVDEKLDDFGTDKIIEYSKLKYCEKNLFPLHLDVLNKIRLN